MADGANLAFAQSLRLAEHDLGPIIAPLSVFPVAKLAREVESRLSGQRRAGLIAFGRNPVT